MQQLITTEQSLFALNQKVDALTAQVAFLAEETRLQQRRRQEMDELKNDLTPVASDMYRVAVRELNEIDSYVQLEDLLRLLKRLMRNTANLEQMLDQLEGMMALWQDLSPLTQDAFLALMNQLETLEQKGYFAFMRGGSAIADQIVTSFTEEDVRQLGDNVVLILQTVKEMTQPEVMTMMRSTAFALREEEPVKDVSLFSILRQLNDPAVKRGLSKTLNVLKTVSEN
jgi:uncharacterized protein YjgD (DUF1641 family)